ncbi:MAG: 3-phosphoglycerate dehydrogenase family protein [Defluviitaleaceae bacterium]|nr:3-phosphoglycerate dehydrogenase family protein [Defluviitaleaceae bacterium]
MYNILTLNEIAQKGINELPEDRFTAGKEISNPEGILVRSAKITDLGDNLLAIARAGAGVNNIPVSDCTKQGIPVFNTPGANAHSVKELVIASLLLASRDVHAGINWTQSLEPNDDVPALVEKNKNKFTGPEIMGKTLGVVGLGAIGGLVANLSHRMGVHVIGFDPYLTIDAAWRISNKVEKVTAEEESSMYGRLDYLTVHIPATDKTKHKFDADFFKKCKPGIKIINFSREELFDNDALLDALEAGIVGKYVTDFPSAKLLGHPNIITMPHIGSSTPEAEENCAVMAGSQIRDYLLYGEIRNSVNFPPCRLPYVGKNRICIFHQNIPNVISSLTTILGSSGFNISEMLSRSSGDVVYTMVDVDDHERDLPEAEILAINGLLRGRFL